MDNLGRVVIPKELRISMGLTEHQALESEVSGSKFTIRKAGSTGFVRNLDSVGRYVIPIEVRRNLDIQEKDELSFSVDEDELILEKYWPGCVFCGEVEGTTKLLDKPICPECLSKIKAS